jgi:hypothetical protein
LNRRCASASKPRTTVSAEIKELLITITIVGLALLAGVGGLALLAYFLVQQQ